MSKAILPAKQRNALLAALSSSENASIVPLKTLIAEGRVPSRLRWAPEVCIKRGRDVLLVHVLVSCEFPAYLEAPITQLKRQRFKRTHVLLLARDAATEAGDGNQQARVPAPIVALKVADRALGLGCAVAVESDENVYLVFPENYQPLPPDECQDETGHIPKWLYGALAQSSAFSPYLNETFRAFAKKYSHATRGLEITNEREVELVTEFASRFAHGDKRLYFPVRQLLVLLELETAKANRGSRDHFFHTFNNLFLGFHILGRLYGGNRAITEVDGFIADGHASKLHPWESLWFLTCMFHDPAYIAEKFWGTFRFSYGVPQGEFSEDEDVPDSIKQKIRDMWDTEFAGARKNLSSLHRRAVRKWTPPTLREFQPDAFDNAVQRAYFDGRNPSHSLVSGLRLINLCQSHNVPEAKEYDPKVALTACVIAALGMMFHDQRCRAVLTAGGIAPIAFEHLPDASLLMFVDALQDDRRDISKSRFRVCGVLRRIEFASEGKVVKALVCLREVSVKDWARRIAEYESVMSWIGSQSQASFRIDYKTEAGLPQ
ncbi:MAG: hypothetical protein WBL65_00515 [Bryobacteraceae bacterium]